MAICIEFNRVTLNGTILDYRYGKCGKVDGLLELDYRDLEQMYLGTIDKNKRIGEIVRVIDPCIGENEEFGYVLRLLRKYGDITR